MEAAYQQAAADDATDLNKPDTLRAIADRIDAFTLDEDVAYDGDRPHYPTVSGLRKILRYIEESEGNTLPNPDESSDTDEHVDGFSDTYQ